MTKGILKSTTGIVLCLGLAMPVPVMAQNNGNQQMKSCLDSPMPPCQMPNGEIVRKEKEPAANAESGGGQQQKKKNAQAEKPKQQQQQQAEPAQKQKKKQQQAQQPVQEQPAQKAEQPPEQQPAQAQELITNESLEKALDAEANERKQAEDADRKLKQQQQQAEQKQQNNKQQQEKQQQADQQQNNQQQNNQQQNTNQQANQQQQNNQQGGQKARNAPEKNLANALEKSTAGEVTAESLEQMVDKKARAKQEAQAAQQRQQAVRPSAAAQADANAQNNAEVTTQTVTRENARSSDEEFQSVASATETKKKGGLSDFEKALLVGAGVIAVGAILKNGDRVVSNTGDRVVVERNGQLQVLKDDDMLLRQPGNEVRTEQFNDGSTRTTVMRPDGTEVVTIRDASGRVLRRARYFQDGSSTLLFDDTQTYEPVDVATLPEYIPQDTDLQGLNDDALRQALYAQSEPDIDRRFSLGQIRDISAVRGLVPEITLDSVTFATGSAAITPSEAEELSELGQAMADAIYENPAEVFLIEGHTDAVGSASSNLALSDRRAESVALALTEYFDVPPENMVVQGYGESQLKIPTLGEERENRRAAVRRITPLLDQQVASNN